ncbi:MAG: M13 family metallopeptidase, partial [Thermoplasmata archaeon]|nr:M13 family metallopeptidase [Thermoplasmata archaeon]
HALHRAAPFLHQGVRDEHFDFFQRTLLGKKQPEPRWRHAAIVIDQLLGEALGQMYVQQHYLPAASARMNDLVNGIKSVFRDRLDKLEWMNEATRRRALAKFDRFRTKIGHPKIYRDYSNLRIVRDDYFGNVVRADAFETLRQVSRAGQPVDREEWRMSPPTVNAYFNPTMNEIVFPAGILQPPFFDATLDDATNYGGIGVVIGHEITHGYDDQGRKYDAEGNLNDWWTKADSKEFDRRAKKVVNQYNGFEPLPGVHVNGQLTLGENIADLGGVSIAYDALQRRLKANPSRRKKIEGFTPEQRFFLAYAQVWRDNTRDPERRRRLTLDPHSPGEFRAVGALANFEPFYEAFGVEKGDRMWLPPPKRAAIW